MSKFHSTQSPYYVGTNDSVTINLSSEESVKLNKNFTLNSDKYISQVTSSVSNLFNSLSTDTVENVQIEIAKNSTEIVTANDINFLNGDGEVVDRYELNFTGYSTTTGLYYCTLQWGIDYQNYYYGYIRFFKKNKSQVTTLFSAFNGSSGTTYTQPIQIYSTYQTEPDPNNNFSIVFMIFLSANVITKEIPITIHYTV